MARRTPSTDLRDAVYGVGLQAAALALLERRRRDRRRNAHLVRADGGLQAFIPRISSRFESPTHLRRFTDALEEAFAFATGRDADAKDSPRVVISVPPRHGKTEAVIHFFAWALSKDPTLELAYVSYAASLAEKKNWRARALARLAGVKLSKDMNTKRDWRTAEGGGVLACGIDGGITGEGFNVLVVDDPHKNRKAAESKVQRDAVEEFFDNDAMTRLHPGGAVVVIHTRWHEDDLAGRLAKRGGWKIVNIPAIADDDTDDEDGREPGEALWPERYPADCQLFTEQQKKPYTWASLYMGRPRPRGTGVFRGATFYSGALPSTGRKVIGVDLAYSAKTSSDWSVSIALLRHVPEAGPGRGARDPLFFVLDVERVQEESKAFELRLKRQRLRHPTARGLFVGSSIEGEVVKNMQGRGLKWLAFEVAKGDKFTRAEDVAVAWNEGRVLLPENPEANDAADVDDGRRYDTSWVDEVLEELWKFTGVSDEHDDVVDALANAHKCAETPAFALR